MATEQQHGLSTARNHRIVSYIHTIWCGCGQSFEGSAPTLGWAKTLAQGELAKHMVLTSADDHHDSPTPG